MSHDWVGSAIFAATVIAAFGAGNDARPPLLAPLVRPDVPPQPNPAWGHNPIDAFVAARLEAANLAPRAEADRATLIRRVTFDLTGLPPTPEAIAAFVADSRADAYERLVDELLASPAFGERFGRAWLDVARFTESQGFEYDRLRERAWPYRDWVVSAFNSDLPYDRFMALQVAGDVLPPVTKDGIVAAGFLVCGPWDEAGNSQANATQRTITRQDELEDLLGTVGQAFLGLTVNCARCHDHKFDPIPSVDYYRLQSVFAGVRHGERALITDDDRRARETKLAALDAEIATLDAVRSEHVSRGAARVRATPVHPQVAAPPSASAPVPILRFDFGADGAGAGLVLRETARIANGRLELDGAGSYAQGEPLARDLRAKTLEAWVSLSTLDQGGGAVISLESGDGQEFDAIVFGEREVRKWMAGSNGFARTRDLGAPVESGGDGDLVHLAIAYHEDGTIAMYRNGEPYGAPWNPGGPPRTFFAGDAHLLLGLRHHGGANGYLRGAIASAALHDRALDAAEVKVVFEAAGLGVSESTALAALTPGDRAEYERVSSDLEARRADRDALPPVENAYVGRREPPEPTRFLRRGDVAARGAVVAPGALSCVTPLDSDFRLAPDAPEAERRVAFSRWLTDPRNPLPSRVIVNRLWHWHFGRGLVATPSDLGVNGGAPSHPELLDWLASELAANGFRLKPIHRLIVTSAAYRQASASDAAAQMLDAENRLLWRFTPRRLDAEMVRDAILATSGALDRTIGGISFRPFDVEPFPANTYALSEDDRPEFRRRSLYRMNVNSAKDTLLDVFDCPDPAIKTPIRGNTTTPLQALVLMNDTFVLREAERFAQRALTECEGDVLRAIERSFRLAFGRAPDESEVRDARELVAAHGLPALSWALFNASEFVDVR